MQKRGLLFPEISTHFRWMGNSSTHYTRGKVYRIKRWEVSPLSTGIIAGYCYVFNNDLGEEVEWTDTWDVVDDSYERNLKEILM